MSDRPEDDTPRGYGPPDDAMTYEETGDETGRGRMVFALAVVMVIAAVAIIYVVFQQGVREGGRNAPPVIVADTGPEKVKPEDPGGLQVPHQDKLVYDRVSGETTERVEKLLPEPEEPVDLTGLRTGESSDEELAQADPVVVEKANEEPISTPTEKPAPKQSEESTAEVKEAETIGELIENIPDESSDIGAAVADVDQGDVSRASGTVGSATSGAYVVQVASVPEAEAASKMWEALLRKNNDLLSSLRPDIQLADLGERGIYYRLRVGPFATKSDANALCSALKARGQDCLVRGT